MCSFSVVLQTELFELEFGQKKHSRHNHNEERNVNEIRTMFRDDVKRCCKVSFTRSLSCWWLWFETPTQFLDLRKQGAEFPFKVEMQEKLIKTNYELWTLGSQSIGSLEQSVKVFTFISLMMDGWSDSLDWFCLVSESVYKSHLLFIQTIYFWFTKKNWLIIDRQTDSIMYLLHAIKIWYQSLWVFLK